VKERAASSFAGALAEADFSGAGRGVIVQNFRAASYHI
jgi:hypothetical protein